MKNFLLLLSVVAGYAFGLYFYSRGFLLTRNTLGRNNTCSDGRISKNSYYDSNESICWIKPRFRRVIWLLIDALRYDFLAPVDEETKNEYYHNKLNIVHELLLQRARNSLLYKFVADAPTTTLQRLKGITTGSLPTFIDASSNFGGAEIEDDNLMDQLLKRGGNITFMGDDTWISLFPRHFRKSFPYPSFDVKDLHTVDNGILEHLYEELKESEKDWNMLIAHFLGVDHCGHKYGPNHPEMASKLEQMNEVIKNVTDLMDSDTILFVLGDHGMTQSGDHGGDSADEVNSALFVYSPKELHFEEKNIRGDVNQIDLVPTVSLLLDVPIPFSNLGKVLIELFPDQQSRSKAVDANVLQVFHFTQIYTANFGDNGQTKPIIDTFYAQEPDELTVEKSLDYIHRISRVFVDCWAKFHIGWMALGLVTFVETLLWLISVLIDRSNSITGRRLFLKLGSFSGITWVVLANQDTIPAMVGIFLGLLIIFHLHIIVSSLIHSENSTDWSMASVFAVFLLMAHGLSQFSNSFVVYENLMSHYFTAALFVVLFLCTSKSTKTTWLAKAVAAGGEKKKKHVSILSKFVQRVESKFYWKSILYVLLALILLRSTAVFGRCREEQFACSSSVFTLPFASVLEDRLKIVRIITSLVSLLISYFLRMQFLSINGHFVGNSILAVLVNFGHTIMVIMIAVYWILQWIPERVFINVPRHFFVTLPMVCYGIFAGILVSFLLDPALVSIRKMDNGVRRRKTPPLLVPNADELSEADTKRIAFEHLIVNWKHYMARDNNRNGELEEDPRLVVFGLASGYSGPLVALFATFAILFALLLGDGFVYPALVFSLLAIVALELGSEKDSDDSLLFVITLCELSSHFFYSFGHQPTFAAIPWDAAFIGLPGNLDSRWIQYIRAAMVILRLSAAHVLVAFLIPLKACWRSYRKKLGIFAVRTDHPNEDEPRTEADLIRGRDGFISKVVYLDCAYLVAAAVKVLCSTLASTVHRRHLMVWKVFAPKFIFDSVHFLITSMAILMQYLFVARLHRALLKKFSHTELISQKSK